MEPEASAAFKSTQALNKPSLCWEIVRDLAYVVKLRFFGHLESASEWPKGLFPQRSKKRLMTEKHFVKRKPVYPEMIIFNLFSTLLEKVDNCKV